MAVARQLNADKELFAFHPRHSFPRMGWRHSLSVATGVVEAQSNVPPPGEDPGLENRAGSEPLACAELQQAAEEADPDAVVWKESGDAMFSKRGQDFGHYGG